MKIRVKGTPSGIDVRVSNDVRKRDEMSLLQDLHAANIAMHGVRILKRGQELPLATLGPYSGARTESIT